MYQGYGGYSVSYENRPCAVCRARGKRRQWAFDEERNKLVKGKMEECDACSGKGWQTVSTTHYNTYPYTVNYTETPNVNPMPYVDPSPTVAPVTFPPFYGSTTGAVNGG
jgi:hypothetical protein